MQCKTCKSAFLEQRIKELGVQNCCNKYMYSTVLAKCEVVLVTYIVVLMISGDRMLTVANQIIYSMCCVYDFFGTAEMDASSMPPVPVLERGNTNADVDIT